MGYLNYLGADNERCCRWCELPTSLGNHSRCRFLFGWRFWVMVSVGVLNVVALLLVAGMAIYLWLHS